MIIDRKALPEGYSTDKKEGFYAEFNKERLSRISAVTEMESPVDGSSSSIRKSLKEEPSCMMRSASLNAMKMKIWKRAISSLSASGRSSG
ncbi:MAG: hypothetical protein AB2L14_26495 [Candidatus Xenobiia bacterium LiM19]